MPRFTTEVGKKSLHYFDLQRYHNTEYWEGIKQGIQSDCANRYKDRKTKLKNILTKLEVQEIGVAKHVEGWREMQCKGSSGWYNELAKTHWGKIMDEKNKSMSSSDGDDTPVNEVEILERSLGQRRGLIRGVGRTVKSVTLDVAPSMSYTPHNQDLHDELRQANARWQEQQEINIRMQQHINELMSRQKAFGNTFDNTYKPTFEEEEDDDDDDDDESE
ncbi:hypothetical protein R6Q59_010320 [Mikania micrantha]